MDPLTKDSDTDNDGLFDYLDSDPLNPDQDNDALPDGWENNKLCAAAVTDDGSSNKDYGRKGDPDEDNLKNWREYTYAIPTYWDKSTGNGLDHGVWWGGTDPKSEDTDSDGWDDYNEILKLAVPTDSNSNPDDTDGDGIPPLLDDDDDNDGLSDNDEINTFKTDPLNPDTDNDGWEDGSEKDYWVDQGYDNIMISIFLKTRDSDDDGLYDGEEHTGDLRDNKASDFDINIYTDKSPDELNKDTSEIVVSDFNDGHPDYFRIFEKSGWELENWNMEFDIETDHITSLAVIDWNNDDLEEFVFVNHITEPEIWLTVNRRFDLAITNDNEYILKSLSGYKFMKLATGDVDNDGDEDIVVIREKNSDNSCDIIIIFTTIINNDWTGDSQVFPINPKEVKDLTIGNFVENYDSVDYSGLEIAIIDEDNGNDDLLFYKYWDPPGDDSYDLYDITNIYGEYDSGDEQYVLHLGKSKVRGITSGDFGDYYSSYCISWGGEGILDEILVYNIDSNDYCDLYGLNYEYYPTGGGTSWMWPIFGNDIFKDPKDIDFNVDSSTQYGDVLLLDDDDDDDDFWYGDIFKGINTGGYEEDIV